MAEHSEILHSVDFIPEVKRQTAGIISIAGEGFGLTADADEEIYNLACKVLYCKYTGEFNGVELPVDTDSIGYTGLNHKYLTVLGFERYKNEYGMIDDIARMIRRDVSLSATTYDYYERLADKTIWNNNVIGPTTAKFFPMIDSSTVVSMNSFKKNATALEMVAYLDVSNVIDMTDAFYGCTRLEVLNLDGLKTDLDLSTCTKLCMDSIEFIIMNAQTVETTKTLTLPSTLINNLPEYCSVFATLKNWTIN